MTSVLAAYREHTNDPELPTVEQLDAAYAHLPDCDPTTDVVIIEHEGEAVAYERPSRSVSGDDVLACVVFAVIHPDHLRRPLYDALIAGQEAHTRPWAEAHRGGAVHRAFADHPGPDRPAYGEAAWLEARGFRVSEWGAHLVRPDLDDVPELELPDGVELRPVEPHQMRHIWEEHLEAFRGEWDFQEPTPEMVDAELAEPHVDHTLWKVAWTGEQVVGQVKSFINTAENDARGYRRGYTEFISTHRDWRNRGIAGALLAKSLVELRDRGMTEAALGVDINNDGGSFHLYTKLGFELRSYDAVYERDLT